MRYESVGRHSSSVDLFKEFKTVRMSKKSGWNHGCDPPSQVPLGKSTHIAIRDVVGTFFVLSMEWCSAR